MKLNRSLLLLATLCLSGTLFATMNDQKAFLEKYPDAKAKLGNCKTCHTGTPKKGEPSLNPYGTDLKGVKAGDKYDFAKIEAKDSDGDGKTNGDEIKAGTNPGDPASK